MLAPTYAADGPNYFDFTHVCICYSLYKKEKKKEKTDNINPKIFSYTFTMWEYIGGHWEGKAQPLLKKQASQPTHTKNTALLL